MLSNRSCRAEKSFRRRYTSEASDFLETGCFHDSSDCRPRCGGSRQRFTEIADVVHLTKTTSIRNISSGPIDERPIDEKWGSSSQGRSSSVDLPHQMIFGDRIAKTKLVDLGHSSDGPSWIDLTENRVTTTESRFTSYLNDFCTKPARAEVDCI